MKNSYKEKFPNAWEDWNDYSELEEIDFKVFHEWALTHNIFIKITEYPDYYTTEVVRPDISREVKRTNEWFEALDCATEQAMKIIEEDYKRSISELTDLLYASKFLDIGDVSKEGILSHYKRLVLEMGEIIKSMLNSIKEGREIGEDDIKNHDRIIMLSIACKKLIL
jgi:hypothetical protein